MSYVAIVAIQLCNLGLAFFASGLAVTGDGGGEGVRLVQMVSIAGICIASVIALLLCRADRQSLAVKLSLFTLPTLFFAGLLFLAGATASLALSVGLGILLIGWAVVIAKAKRRLCQSSPTSLSSVIFQSKFSGLEWLMLLAVASIAVVAWYQLLKATAP